MKYENKLYIAACLSGALAVLICKFIFNLGMGDTMILAMLCFMYVELKGEKRGDE